MRHTTLGLCAALGCLISACGSDDGSVDGGGGTMVEGATDENLRVAFIGDQGLGSNARAVLGLIAGEQADFVIHEGDFDYADDPDAWDAQIDEVLGADYPYFSVVGNHDVDAWAGYAQHIEERIARIDGAECSGDLGVKARCSYRGLFFVLSGVGTMGDTHVEHISAELSADDSLWKVCNWHKNMADMQVGEKGDEVGWPAYQACQSAGAMVITGHEHSYSRTLNLDDVGNAAAGHGAGGEPGNLELEPGKTFVVVTGLAGQSQRVYVADLHDDDTWWASIYAQTLQMKNGEVTGSDFFIDYGALFVDFYVDGDPRKARGYFKTVAGDVVDEFSIRLAQ